MYQWDPKLQREKHQVYRGQYESLKMKEEKVITTFFQNIDGVVNTTRGLGNM